MYICYTVFESNISGALHLRSFGRGPHCCWILYFILHYTKISNSISFKTILSASHLLPLEIIFLFNEKQLLAEERKTRQRVQEDNRGLKIKKEKEAVRR